MSNVYVATQIIVALVSLTKRLGKTVKYHKFQMLLFNDLKMKNFVSEKQVIA